MKIMFHLNSMGIGGAERVVSILSDRLVKEGYDVLVATEWFSEKEYPLNDKVKRLMVGISADEENKSRISKAVLRLKRLRKEIKDETPDAVISFCAKANYRAAFALAGKGIPLIASVRNDPSKDYKKNGILVKHLASKASGCVFQTPDAKEFFPDKLQKKSKVILNPIAEEYLKSVSTPVKESKKEIVSIGRISAQKNQMMLLKAFSGIADKYKDYSLKIYGEYQEGDTLEELRRYIKENCLENRAYLMGTSDNMTGILKESSMFVLSSDYEGLPNALIEAMVLGKPCISTDCPSGGPGLLIENGKSGILVPIGDTEALKKAMEWVMDNPGEAEQMGKEASKLIEKVNPDTICSQWIEYIESVVNR